MGSKGQNSTSTVTIPPQVLANYAQVNQRAAQVDNQPFQAFTGQAVAPVNAQQTAGINATNTAAGSYQPYTNAATGYAVQGGQAVNPNALDINKYLSPYLGDVVGSESALLNQNNQQQQSGQLGTAIQSGAFGGDRAGIAAANLAGQQNLTNANIYSNLLNQGYNTALGTAQQQQGVDLSAGQANRAATQQTGQTLANLGAQTQGLGLAGANAQINAGTLQQQTAQAGDTFNYQQYLAQQSLPYQQLGQQAGIAEAIGANSGSTTTTNTVANGIFSDERLKHDIEEVGKTFDGQPIYTYKYNGDHRTQMGLMAQNVEKKHPHAVGLAAGYKTVDYKKATDGAAKRGHFASGGRTGLAAGGALPYDGSPTITDMMASRFQQMYGGLLTPQTSIVPQTAAGNAQLHPAQANLSPQASPAQQATDYANAATAINKAGTGLGAWGKPQSLPQTPTLAQINGGPDPFTKGQTHWSNPDNGAPISTSGSPLPAITPENDPTLSAVDNRGPLDPGMSMDGFARGGRMGYADGGDIPYQGDGIDVPDDVNTYTLHPAQPAGGSAPQDNTMKDVGQIASMVAMFAARGGRAERADGGGVDTPPLEHGLAAALKPYGKYKNLLAQLMEAGQSPPVPQTASPDDQQPDDADEGQMTAPATTGLGAATPSASAPPAVHISGKMAPSGKIDPDVVDYLSSNGIPKTVALGVAAGVNAESRNNPAAINKKSGAFGLEQLLGPRKEHFVSKYGESTSKQDQLENLLWELKGGDRGGASVLSSDSPEEALRNYVTKFMRPKAGAETTGDIQRGLGALRHGFAQGGTPAFNDPNYDAATSTDLSDPSLTDPTLDPRIKYRDPQWDAQTNTGLGAAMPPIASIPSAHPPEAASTPQQLPVGAQPDPDTNSGYEPRGKFFDRLKSGKSDAVLSLLSGLSAAATANTRNPLYAIASGLGAGAQSYQQQREFGLEKQQADTNQMQAQGQILAPQRAALMSMYHYNPNLLNPQTGKYGMYIGPSGAVTPDEYASRVSGTIIPSSGIHSPAGLSFDPKALLGQTNPMAPASIAPPAQPVSPVIPSSPSGEPAYTPPAAPIRHAAAIDGAPVAQASPQATHAPAPYSSDAYRAKSGVQFPADSVAQGVPDEYRVDKLQQQYSDGMKQAVAADQAGNPQIADQFRQNANAAKARAEGILNGSIPVAWTDPNGQTHQYQGYYNYSQKQKQAEAAIQAGQARAQTALGEAQAFPRIYGNLSLALKDIDRASANENVQGHSGAWSNAAAWVRSLPYADKITPDSWKALNNASDTISQAKGAAAISQALEMQVGARAVGTTERLIAGQNTDLKSPAGRYAPRVRAGAELEREKGYNAALQARQSANGGDFADIDGFNHDFYAKHPIENYYSKVVQGTPFYDGMTPKDMQDYKPYLPVVNSANLPKVLQPGQYGRNKNGAIIHYIGNGKAVVVGAQ